MFTSAIVRSSRPEWVDAPDLSVPALGDALARARDDDRTIEATIRLWSYHQVFGNRLREEEDVWSALITEFVGQIDRS